MKLVKRKRPETAIKNVAKKPFITLVKYNAVIIPATMMRIVLSTLLMFLLIILSDLVYSKYTCTYTHFKKYFSEV